MQSTRMEVTLNIKVMLADDHVLMREGIRQLLEFDGSIEVIGEASDGEECLQKLEKVKPDVLLLDINMPKLNGIEVLEEIKRKKINVKVLILTVHNEVDYLIRAVDIGVDGYILKDSESAELKKAIMTVMDGESYIQPKLIPMLNKRLITRDSDKEKLESFFRTTDFKLDHPEAFSDWLVAVANDDRYIKAKQLIDKQNEKGGHINMCVLLDMYEERGEARGIHEINTLNLRLLDDNRLEDMQRAMVDTDYQKELMKEYGIGK